MKCLLPTINSGLVLALVVSAFSLPASFADEPEVLKESFDQKTDLKWTVIRSAKDHVSLETNPGMLTLKTQRGTIHGDEKNDAFSGGTQAKNIHPVDREIPDNVDFEATIAVRKFEPQLFYHQIALIAYQDDDNYAKFSMEKTNNPRGQTQVLLVCEDRARPTHNMITPTEIDGPFWLRFERTGPDWICRHSRDGKTFQAIGVHTFEFSDKKRPIKVGFLAKNGGNPAAAEIDVLFDSFELKIFPPVAEVEQE